ncbi:MAG TPA: FAD-dependent oxidoreductase [Bacillota bacterium]|nr:FAD-dependent oxidoreductase [Bacillota bacterium]
MKRIIVLGAGYAGLEAAKNLHKKLRKQNDVEIMLIDQSEHHTLLTGLHEVAGGRVESTGVKVSIDHILQYTGVKFVQDRISRADLAAKKLYSKDQIYSFDYLIAGIGSEPAFYEIPGLEENAFTLWSLDDAKSISQHIRNMFKQASGEKNEEKRRELLTIVVGGGGFTGIETIGELMQWTKTLCREYGLDRKEVRLVVAEALPTILTNLTDKSASRAVRYMERRGVEVLVNSAITEVTKRSVSLEGGETIKTSTLIWTGGIQTKTLVNELGVTVGSRNRIVVNQYCQTVEYPYVYAAGDNMEFVDEDGQTLPALVETAMLSGKLASQNIAADIQGQEKRKLKANLHGTMVSIGSLYGVAELRGMPRMSGIFAIIVKHLVNLHYLFGLGGLELCWTYLNHQIFDTKRNYGFILQSAISHARERSFKFWLVPLRLYLGYKWLMSAIEKIDGGWWAQTVLGDSAMSGATPDAASAATGLAEEVGNGLIPLIGENTPGWYVSFVENLVYPNSLLFQRMIIMGELALGLLFIVGMFTFLAAIASILMNVNFLLSTGIHDWWYIWVSFAMFAGAGRVLGVDHYLMPWLRNQLRYFQRNKKISLFKGWQL